MPCRDYESDWEISHNQQERLDILAKLLCESQKLLREWAVPEKAKSEELREWWKLHQESDRLAAIEEEETAKRLELIKSAENKLTAAELSALIESL